MTTTYLLGIAFAVLVLVAIFLRLRNSGMKERYATWWIIIAIVIVVFSVFPGLLEGLAKLVGVQVALNLGFFLGGIAFLIICLQYSVDLSRAAEERRRLVEEVALLRLEEQEQNSRIAALEALIADKDEDGAGGSQEATPAPPS